MYVYLTLLMQSDDSEYSYLPLPLLQPYHPFFSLVSFNTQLASHFCSLPS